MFFSAIASTGCNGAVCESYCTMCLLKYSGVSGCLKTYKLENLPFWSTKLKKKLQSNSTTDSKDLNIKADLGES